VIRQRPTNRPHPGHQYVVVLQRKTPQTTGLMTCLDVYPTGDSVVLLSCFHATQLGVMRRTSVTTEHSLDSSMESASSLYVAYYYPPIKAGLHEPWRRAVNTVVWNEHQAHNIMFSAQTQCVRAAIAVATWLFVCLSRWFIVPKGLSRIMRSSP